MKKLSRFVGLWLILSMLSIIFSGMTSVCAEVNDELISDGGFENMEGLFSTSGEVSVQNADVEQSGVYTAQSGTDPYVHSGTKSAKVVQTGGNSNKEAGLNFANIHLEEGKAYRLSAWVRYDTSFTGDGILSMVFAGGANAGDYFSKGARTAKISGAQEMQQITADVTALATETVRIKISSNAQQGEIFYIDDVSCIELAPPPPDPSTVIGYETVTDGSFEDYELDSSFPTNGNFRVNDGMAQIVNTKSSQGSQALKITANEGKQAAINCVIPLKKGLTYYFSADVCYESGYAGGAYIRMSDTSFDFADRARVSGLHGGGEFVTIGTHYTADKDYANARLNLVIEQNGGVAYVDNISCKVAEPLLLMVADNNLMGKDASFERQQAGAATVGNGRGEVTDKYANRGKYSFCVTHDSEKAPNNEVGINFGGQTLTAGKTYRFGAYVRMDEQHTGNNYQFYVRIMDDSGGGQLARVNSPHLTGTNDFTLVSVVYKAVSDVTGLRLNIGMTEKNGAVGYIDDVFLEEVVSVDDIAGNLIQNGGFEESSGFVSSQAQLNYQMANAHVTVIDAYDTDYVHRGQSALKIVQGEGGGSVIFEVNDLVPGGNYTFGAWVRFDKALTTQESIYINDYLGQGLTQSIKMTGASGYTFISREVTVPENTTKMKFQVKADTGASDSGKKFTYYIDDVSLVRNIYEVSFGSARLQKPGVDAETWIIADYDDMTSGKRRFTVSDITNPTAEDKTIQIFIGLFDSSERCFAVESTHISVPSGTSVANVVSVSAELIVPEGIEGGRIKTFIWNAESMEPYDKPIKLLIIGNSITKHAPDASKGWLHDWGMAATAQEKDYAHLLLAKAQEKAPGIRMELCNITDFERNFHNYDGFDTSKYQDLVDYDPDIIICTIGANVKNPVPEGGSEPIPEEMFSAEYYKKIIDFFNPNGNAKVLTGSTIFTSAEVLAGIEDAAEKYHYPYVKMTDLVDKEPGDKYYTAWPFRSYFPENIIDGVLNHPGDHGMAEMANRLWPKLEELLEDLGE